jgi:hypothetical protein
MMADERGFQLGCIGTAASIQDIFDPALETRL